jgi:uncharacterized protein YcbK (DUF882 family)
MNSMFFRVLALTLATSALHACALFTVRTDAPGPTPAAPPPPLGDAEVLTPLTVRSHDTPDPQVVIAMAWELALVATEQLVAENEGGETTDGSETTPAPDPMTEAWVRVNGAVIYGEVASLPSPESRPVSVEQQMIAREQRNVAPGHLRLHAINTGDHYDIQVYDANGRMRVEAIGEVSIALRDARSGRSRTIHPRTIAMLYMVGQYYDVPLQVVSGYRVRGVNATEGSRHGSGEACDFRIPDVGVRNLARWLDNSFADVGVGYYPRSGFVHLDRRDRSFYWIDNSGPGQRSRTRSRSAWEPAEEEADITLRSVHITEEELYQLPPRWREYGYND